MSSLVPGSLFYSTGLNRKHTPTPPTITNDELEKRYKREPFNGRPWPASSPVSGVYDIRNTTTQLILLNNRKKKESQLRGRNNPRKEEHRYPEPERHSRCSTPVDRDRHTKCIDSSSPYYEPDVNIEMDWLNRSQRPPNRFGAGSAVNPKRHTSCQVPSVPRAFDIRLHSPTGRPNSRTSLPANFGKGMSERELTPGEQRYFGSITRVYSTNQMIRLKRRQYIDLLNQELSKGFYTKKEYQRYRDYIALGRQRQYLNVKSRAMSAPVRRSSYGNETERSISSISADDKSSVTEQEKHSPDKKQPSSKNKETQQTKRSSTPDKRPPSVKSNTSSKKSVSSGRISPEKSSRSSSAKSTKSTPISVKIPDQNETQKETKEPESAKKEESESKKESDTDNETIHKEQSHKVPENDASDSDTNLPTDLKHSGREGKDRPKSRLGHIPEDSKSENDDNELAKIEKEIDDKELMLPTSTSNENSEDTTQEQKEEDNQKTKLSRTSDDDISSSDEEKEKDPDKLQY